MKKPPFPARSQHGPMRSACRTPRSLKPTSLLLRCLAFLLVAALSPWAASQARAAAPNPGDIITIAGQNIGDNGPATQARLASTASSKGVLKDGAGNLYVSDAAHNSVRKVDAATGIITTFAGSGSWGYSGDGALARSASLNNPQGLAMDAAGNLFIADMGNQRVRKVSPAGVISTVAGNGTAAFSGDGDLAIYASLNNPRGLAVDNAGNLYIADSFNHRVRKVDAAGVITTVAGNGASSAPTGNGDGGSPTVATVGYPYGVTLDASGNLYVAEGSYSRIRKIDAAGTVISTFASGFCGMPSVVYHDGSLFVPESCGWITRLDLATSVRTRIAGLGGSGFSGDGGPATSAVFYNPWDLFVDSGHNVYVYDGGNKRVRMIAAATGIITTVVGSGSIGDGAAATEASLANPSRAIVDDAGDLYIADGGNYRVRKVAANSGVITTFAGNGGSAVSGDGGPAVLAGLGSPSDIALDADGNLIIAAVNRVRKVDVSTGIISLVGGNGSTSYLGDGVLAKNTGFGVSSIAVDHFNNVYLGDASNHRIRKIDQSTGIVTTVAGSGVDEFSGDGGPALAAGLMRPFAIAFDQQNNLYFGDLGTRRVRKIDFLSGIISTVAGNGTAGYTGDGGPAPNASIGARGIAFDAQGNLYLASGGKMSDGTMAIRKVDAATGIITTVVGNGTNGFSGDGGPAVNATVSRASGVSFDAAGNMYIADRGNGRVRKVFAAVPDTVAPAVSVSPPGQTYSLAQTVTLTASEAATVYYTLDGSDPRDAGGSRASFDSSGQVLVASSATLRYYAVDRAGNASVPAQQSYTITYQAVLNPEYQSTESVVLSLSAPTTELAHVSLSSRVLTYSGQGILSGANTLTNDRVVAILSGTYAGWEYGTGSYNFSGLQGNAYYVKRKNQIWRTLVGDIEGVMISDEGSLHVVKLHVASLAGSAAPQVLHLWESSRTNGPTSHFPDTTLTITQRTLTSTLSGYANATLQRGGPLVRAELGGKTDGIGIEDYQSSGVPGKAYTYHGDDRVVGLFRGPVFATFYQDATVTRYAHLLAVATQVRAGDAHGAAVKTDGSLWTWGNNTYGQLGNGATLPTSSMARSVLSGMLAVSAGAKHSLALNGNGALLAWGDNSSGALGTGDTANWYSPKPVAAPARFFRSVSAGNGFSLALDLDGTAWSWGDNSTGQLGSGSSASYSPIPQQLQHSPGALILALAAGGSHGLALMDDFTVRAWGGNGNGQLGDDAVGFSLAPIAVQLPGSAHAVAAGNGHSLVLLSNGTVWGWGSNNHGQLGNGSLADSAAPVQVQGLSGVVAIAAGYDHSLALKEDGTVWAWGGGSHGQLGANDPGRSDAPLPVSVRDLSGAPLSGIVSIAAGNAFSLALANDGKMYAWGIDNFRQLAVGGSNDFYYATPARMNLIDTVPPTVTASHVTGSYSSPITVTLTSSETFLPMIYYTLDGSDPFTSSTRKLQNNGSNSVAIPISATTTLRYGGLDGAANRSQSYSQTYSFNLAPSISGTPPQSAQVGTPYGFTPQGSVASGTISYSVSGKPDWLSFSASTGALTGTPGPAHIGTYPNIVIQASANGLSAALPPFSVTVTSPVLQGATTFLAINQGERSTGNGNVTLNLGCSLGDKCAFMQFSNDNLIWSAPEPFAASKNWVLPSEDGLKTVYVNFLDAAGAASNTYFSNIILTGTTSPAGSYLFSGKWGTDSSANGKFFQPASVAWSRSDRAVYVADSQNCRIQKFDDSLAFVNKWGGCGYGDGQFVALTGVATDSVGNVYVADKNRIQKFAPDGSLITKWPGQGSSVSMIAVGPDDTVYVTGANYVQLFDHNGRYLTQWRINESVTGIAVDAGNTIYLRGYNYIWQYDATGALQANWAVPALYNVAAGSSASGLAVDPVSGNLALADVNAHTVRIFSPPDPESGSPASQELAWGGYGPGSGQLRRPQGVAFDQNGALYIADTGNQRLLKIAEPYTETSASLGAADLGSGAFNLPVSVAFDPASGSLFVTDMHNDRIQEFSSSGQQLNSWGFSGSGPGQFSTPLDAVPDGRGSLFVLDAGNNRVQKISLASGQVSASFGNLAGPGLLANPRRLALDRLGNLYVAQHRQVSKYDADGNFLASWSSYAGGANPFFYGVAIAIDSHGSSDIVYLVDSSNRRVLKFDTSGNPLGVIADAQLANLSSIAVDQEGFVYLFDGSVGAINKFDPLGNLVTNWGNKAAVLDGSMRHALGLAVDGAGDVYVADTNNNRIQKFSPAGIPNGSASINSGAGITLSRSVDLTLFGRTNVGFIKYMRFSNDNLTWSGWEPYATTKTGWQLPDRPGTNYVYVQFQNSYGIVSSTVKAAITLQYQLFTVVTAPVDSYTPVSVTPTADASMNVTFQSVISATANSGVKVTAALTPPPPPADLKVYNSQVYEIKADGITFAGTPEVCLAFRPSAVSNPDNMKIMHYNGSAWEDITTRRTYDLTSDTGKVCGNTTSFSPFMLGETLTAVDGVCGAAHGGTFVSIPVDYLCGLGGASPISGTGPWNWSCSGSNGGNPVSCSAARLVYQSAPVTTASPAAGSYSGNSILVTLSTTNSATIYYTTDGTVPSTASAVYGAPISISGTVTLKYFAKDSSANSEPVKVSAYSVTPSTQPGASYSGIKAGSSFTVSRSEGGKPFAPVVTGTSSTSYSDGSALLPNTIYRYAVSSDLDPSQTVFLSVRTPLYNGWNIVAVPSDTAGVQSSACFTTPVSSTYEWIPAGATVESSDAVLGSYKPAGSLAPGKGYFVKASNGSTMLAYGGRPGQGSVTVTLKPGWTMIASQQAGNRGDIGTNWLIDGNKLSDAIEAGTIGGSVYWWNGTTYESWRIMVDNPQIEPWKGYWILNLDPVSNHTLTLQ